MARALPVVRELFSGVPKVLESMDEVAADLVEMVELVLRRATQRACRRSESGAKADAQLCRYGQYPSAVALLSSMI